MVSSYASSSTTNTAGAISEYELLKARAAAELMRTMPIPISMNSRHAMNMQLPMLMSGCALLPNQQQIGCGSLSPAVTPIYNSDDYSREHKRRRFLASPAIGTDRIVIPTQLASTSQLSLPPPASQGQHQPAVVKRRKTTNKHVFFAPSTSLVIIHSHEYTQQDIQNAWYSRQHYKDFVSDCKSILESVRGGNRPTDECVLPADQKNYEDTGVATPTATTQSVSTFERKRHVDESCTTRGLESQIVSSNLRMQLRRRRYLIKTVVEQYAFCKKEWEQRRSVGRSDSSSSSNDQSDGVSSDFCADNMISSWIRDVSLRLSVNSTQWALQLGAIDENYVMASVRCRQ